MKKENLLLLITGGICAAGCLFLSAWNAWQGSHPRADVIPPSEYTATLLPSAPDGESNGESDADGQAAPSTADDTSVQATININTATADELAAFLPGIGEVKAKRIVEYRETAGGFDSVDELLNVKGIGEKTLQNLRPYCRVSDE